MTKSNLEATSIGIDQQTKIPLKNLKQRLLSGEVVVVSECLQGIGYYEQIRQASLAGIRQAVEEEKAAQLKNRGFEAFHDIITLDELPKVSDRVYETIRSITPELSKAIVKQVFQQEQPFYCEEYPNVRFHVPYDEVVKNKDEFSKFYWNGKVTAHGPHHDSWYQCPVNCVNIWIAIGSVKIGNGLNIYPDAHGKRLPCTKDGKILGNQYCGSKISFDLKPGDALIFHGEHLHSSEINSTDATRYVVSLRMTLDRPQFLDRSPYRHNYIYSHPQDGLTAKLAASIAEISRRLAKKTDSMLIKPEDHKYVISNQTGTVFNDTSADLPKQIAADLTIANDQASLAFDSSDLPIGSVKPISPKMCVARLDSDRVVAFSRYCSHEGADLAGGELKDGKIFCPWHNLPFDLENGSSPCQSLPKLKVVECKVDSHRKKIHS
jgi:nitrite reductase/ring-hydroxylating ferredoxin subunit